MKVRNSLLLTSALILGSCATKVVGIYNHDINRKTPTTYQLTIKNESNYLSAANQKLDSTLQLIISESLREKGLKSSSLPDLYVSYIINVFSSSETSSNHNNMYGYSYSSNLNHTTRNYKEGVLIIEIVDEDRILVWQGSKTFKLRSKLSVQDMLPEICREVIAVYNK